MDDIHNINLTTVQRKQQTESPAKTRAVEAAPVRKKRRRRRPRMPRSSRTPIQVLLTVWRSH